MWKQDEANIERVKRLVIDDHKFDNDKYVSKLLSQDTFTTEANQYHVNGVVHKRYIESQFPEYIESQFPEEMGWVRWLQTRAIWFQCLLLILLIAMIGILLLIVYLI